MAISFFSSDPLMANKNSFCYLLNLLSKRNKLCRLYCIQKENWVQLSKLTLSKSSY